ncbi:MAG: sulfatase-like hydrolase/transferase [Acidobacteriota bacterium]
MAGLLAAAFCTGCGLGDRPERLNVLLVTFDTTRADHIGAYGHRAARTPVLDALAAEGVLFESAYAPVPITLPSHSSLMTGKVPFVHGVRDNGLFVLGDEQLTLAEILKERGYRTAAAIASFPLTGQFGIGQGFDLFDDHVTAELEDLYGERVVPKNGIFFDERPAARVNDAILPWLDENADEPFFLWAHYFDPHHPHRPPAPYDQLFAHDLYDGEIAYSDESFGVLLKKLQDLGVADRTLVVFTSDHGEGRGEHGESTHALLNYNSTLRVPLIFSKPGGPTGRRVAQSVSTVDIMPTILELLGVDLPEELDGQIQGESLGRFFGAEEDPGDGRSRRQIYAETLSPRLTRQWGELRTLFYGDYKLIHGPRPELYDLARDPRELEDLIATEPDIARDLERRLEGFIADNAVSDIDASVALDEESVRRLQALGYLQSSGDKVGPLEEQLRQDGEAPQDHAETISIYSQAKSALASGRSLEARDLLRDLLSRDPGNVHYVELELTVARQLGQADEALRLLDQLSESSAATGYPPVERIQGLRAEIFLQRGDIDTAYDYYREVVAVAPSAPILHRLAQIHQIRGEDREARRFLEKSIEEDAGFAPAHLDLAVSHAVGGDVEAAQASFTEALRLQPYAARAHYNFAAFLAQTDQIVAAIERLERALELRPAYPQALQAQVELHLLDGDLDGARTYMARLEAQAPGSAPHQAARELMTGYLER